MDYKYKAKVIRVIDGDTVVFSIDCGFKIKYEAECRFYGINTPELRKKEQKEAALVSKKWVEDNIGTDVVIYSKEIDKYGRPLVVVYNGDLNLNDKLIELGLAVKY
jgi:micrococcal nuclease